MTKNKLWLLDISRFVLLFKDFSVHVTWFGIEFIWIHVDTLSANVFVINRIMKIFGFLAYEWTKLKSSEMCLFEFDEHSMSSHNDRTVVEGLVVQMLCHKNWKFLVFVYFHQQCFWYRLMKRGISLYSSALCRSVPKPQSNAQNQSVGMLLC